MVNGKELYLQYSIYSSIYLGKMSNRQIDNMFPELDITYEEQGIDYIFVFRKDQILREYFGKKLPFDGNPDYFSSE